jgi:hypothetical protein
MQISLIALIALIAYDVRRRVNVTADGKNISRERVSRTNGGARHIR